MLLINRINVINDNDTFNELSEETFNHHLEKQQNNDTTRLFVSKRLNYIFSFISMIGIIFYILFIFFCSNKQEYEDLHPYLTIIPVSQCTLVAYTRTYNNIFFF